MYRDHHTRFARAPQEPWTLEEELAGERVPTQLERLFLELGIHSIPAFSPQAKGRIERPLETFQSRLVMEVRLPIGPFLRLLPRQLTVASSTCAGWRWTTR